MAFGGSSPLRQRRGAAMSRCRTGPCPRQRRTVPYPHRLRISLRRIAAGWQL